MDITLQRVELDELLKQDPGTKQDGGFQALMVQLQKRVDTATGNLTLSESDLEKIRRYAFGYKKGGWQNRLLAIFSRTLGPALDGSTNRATY